MPWTEPSDEQLALFASVLVASQLRRRFGAGGASIAPTKEAVLEAFALEPSLREKWLRQHREFQEATDAMASAS